MAGRTRSHPRRPNPGGRSGSVKGNRPTASAALIEPSPRSPITGRKGPRSEGVAFRHASRAFSDASGIGLPQGNRAQQRFARGTERAKRPTVCATPAGCREATGCTERCEWSTGTSRAPRIGLREVGDQRIWICRAASSASRSFGW